MSDRKDFFDTPVGNVVATIVWALGRVLSFFIFTVIGGIIHFFSRRKS